MGKDDKSVGLFTALNNALIKSVFSKREPIPQKPIEEKPAKQNLILKKTFNVTNYNINISGGNVQIGKNYNTSRRRDDDE